MYIDLIICMGACVSVCVCPSAFWIFHFSSLLLDTSVIIDGRIADIATTGFVEGTLIVPQFVIGELQYIADSSDTLKRNRGRRGLDILKELQENKRIQVEIYDGDFEDVPEVDIKLIKLAELKNGIKNIKLHKYLKV